MLISFEMAVDKIFKCDQCSFSTKYNYNLKPHVKAVHDGMQVQSCDKCEYKSSHKKSLTRHQKKAHTNDENHGENGSKTAKDISFEMVGADKIYKCDQCEEEFRSNAALKSHVKSDHKKEKLQTHHPGRSVSGMQQSPSKRNHCLHP